MTIQERFVYEILERRVRALPYKKAKPIRQSLLKQYCIVSDGINDIPALQIAFRYGVCISTVYAVWRWLVYDPTDFMDLCGRMGVPPYAPKLPEEDSRYSYFYVGRIGIRRERLVKIGYTASLKRRRRQHERTYNAPFRYLMYIRVPKNFGPVVEAQARAKLKADSDLEYIPTDRFRHGHTLNNIMIEVLGKMYWVNLDD